MANKKKRKFKKGFKILLWVFFLLIILGGIFYLNYTNVINLNKFWADTTEIYENVKTKFTEISNKQKDKQKDKSVFINTSEGQGFSSEQDKGEEFIKTFRNRLPSKNLNFASSSKISQSGDMKIYLKNTKDNSGYIFVNTKDDVNYVWITFVSAIDVNPLKEELEKKLEYLDYIDLRFSNKVFYKFHEEKSGILDKKNEDDIISSTTLEILPTVSTSTFPL